MTDSPSDPPSPARHGSPTGRLAAGAAAVAVVAGLVTAAVRLGGDDPVTSVEPPATRVEGALATLPAPESGQLLDGALAAALAAKRWVAIERFDDPSPTALTSVIDVVGSDGAAALELEAHDGCNGYGGVFELDGSTVVTDGFSGEGADCGVDVLALRDGQRIELAPGADTFMLRDGDGAPVATFVDEASLESATPDDLPGTRFLDELQSVTFTLDGRGSARCAQLSWTQRDADVVIGITAPASDTCPTVDDPDARTNASGQVFLDLLRSTPITLRTPAGLLVTDRVSAVQLRDAPDVAVEPDGITIAAGAAFGFTPRIGVGVDDVVDVVGARLGSPDFDSGWVAATGTGSQESGGSFAVCDLPDYREIAWGDLVYGFYGAGSRTLLQFWFVGDERVVASPRPDVERPTATTGAMDATAALATEHGVRVGDPIGQVPDRFNIDTSPFGESGTGPDLTRTNVISANPDAEPGRLAPPIRSGSYLSADGRVVGIGAETYTC